MVKQSNKELEESITKAVEEAKEEGRIKDVEEAIKLEEQAKNDKEQTLKNIQEPTPAPKRTLCRLVSKADYIIRVEHNGQSLFIQPYGWAKVIREQIKVDRNDAKYLTFVKL